MLNNLYITCGAQRLGIRSNQLHYWWSECFTLTLHPPWKSSIFLLYWLKDKSVVEPTQFDFLNPFETDVTISASQMQENTELLVRFRDNIFAILNGYSSLLGLLMRCVSPGNLETWEQTTNKLLLRLIIWGTLFFLADVVLSFEFPLVNFQFLLLLPLYVNLFL